ncbi:hypothetical protein PB01_07535 [Psychrobacillus glaciei]|uniref:Uncharacterized protein n=1 Tax=Psychrobacillus glaciei TaxID=2283160 RepID=A0A5J6SPL6_9BACI|nr:hypothetical protein [Psychrobacillus glaciei]QFF98694.1 hypothetical protein PB01_07535 [Psychrobacillus glaciei]
MPSITVEDYHHFENNIYLPMLIKILEKDVELINRLTFKLHRPYLKVVDNALELIRKDLKQSDIYLIRFHMRLIKDKLENGNIEYTYISSGYEERHALISTQLKGKTEELMTAYLYKK